MILHLERGTAPPVRAHESEAGVLRGAGDLQVFNESTRASLQARLAELFEVEEVE